MIQSLDNWGYEIIELVRSNRSDDSSIDLRLAKERIGNLRSLALRNQFSNVRTVEQVYVQDLGCLALEEVDPIECDNVTGDNYIFRTVEEVPKPIDLPGGLLFTRVGPVDKTKPNFNYYNYEQTYYSEYNRFGKNQINVYYRNNRIYVFAHECVDFIKLLDNINVQGVFDSPEDVNALTCFDSTEVYPISRWMKESITKTIVQEFSNKLNTPEDNINDGANQ